MDEAVVLAAVVVANATAAMAVVVINHRMETIIATCAVPTIPAKNMTVTIDTMADVVAVIALNTVATEVMIAASMTTTTAA